jgi:5-methylcytosine-specific restriction endonuclease McrA
MTTKTQQRAKRAAQRRGRKRPSGQWIRTDARLAIYLRDGMRCVYCGRDLHGAAPEEMTLDHVWPWSLGGENEPTNLVTACKHCNSSRGARLLASYADAHTRAAVRRQTARSITRYRALARDLLSGASHESGLPVAE